MRLRIALSVLFSMLVFLFATTASAQATRTWVSGVGDDVNPCSRTAPCKTFAGAISKTAAGGIINALDPGGYGNVSVTKSITIDMRGTMGSILNSQVTGVIVNAGATDVVTLRGVTIQGATIPGSGQGTFGVRFLAGASLHVEDCLIMGQATAAIEFKPAAAASLFVKNSTITNNAAGIIVGGKGNASITNTNFFSDVTALQALDTAKITVHDSVFFGNTGKAVVASGASEININKGFITGNGIGVQGDAPVRLSDVMIGHNTTGIVGAQVKSFGNNRIAAGNTADGTVSGTIPQQ